MWLCSLVQLLAPSLIDDEPRSSMSTSGRTALPPPPRGGLIRPRRVGLYRTGPPPPHRGGFSRPPTRRVGLGCTRPPSRRIVLGSHLPSPPPCRLGWVALAFLLFVVLGWVVLTLLLVVVLDWVALALLLLPPPRRGPTLRH